MEILLLVYRLFLLFVSLGIPQGYTTVVLAHITFCTPYVVSKCVAAFETDESEYL